MEQQSIPSFPMMGMPPSVWGPILWTSMHIVSIGYSQSPSQEEKQATIHYYKSLAHAIPCSICREHYKYHIAESPVEHAVGSRDELIYWLFSLHNKVNKSLNKPELSFEQYITNMANLANRASFSFHSHASTPTWIPAVVGVAMGGAAVYAWYKYKQ